MSKDVNLSPQVEWIAMKQKMVKVAFIILTLIRMFRCELNVPMNSNGDFELNSGPFIQIFPIKLTNLEAILINDEL